MAIVVGESERAAFFRGGDEQLPAGGTEAEERIGMGRGRAAGTGNMAVTFLFMFMAAEEARLRAAAPTCFAQRTEQNRDDP